MQTTHKGQNLFSFHLICEDCYANTRKEQIVRDLLAITFEHVTRYFRFRTPFGFLRCDEISLRVIIAQIRADCNHNTE